MSLATLAEALEWLEARWAGQRPVPMRLHSRGTEGRFTVQGFDETYTGGTGDRLGSPPFSPAFMAALTGSAAATMVVTITKVDDTGVYTRSADRYRYPMSLALDRLSKVKAVEGHAHPYAIVCALAEYGWDSSRVSDEFALSWNDMLRAIRQLYSRYEEGPISRPSWIDKSESQRQAEAV